MGLPCGENCIILTSTVFDWSTRVSDRRTDRRTGDIIHGALKTMYVAVFVIEAEKSPRRLSGQSLIDYLGAHLQVNYSRTEVVLTNSGPLDIPPGIRWTIYFSHLGMWSFAATTDRWLIQLWFRCPLPVFFCVSCSRPTLMSGTVGRYLHTIASRYCSYAPVCVDMSTGISYRKHSVFGLTLVRIRLSIRLGDSLSMLTKLSTKTPSCLESLF